MKGIQFRYQKSVQFPLKFVNFDIKNPTKFDLCRERFKNYHFGTTSFDFFL